MTLEPKLPVNVWDGLTPRTDRVSTQQVLTPDGVDWNKIVLEVRQAQALISLHRGLWRTPRVQTFTWSKPEKNQIIKQNLGGLFLLDEGVVIDVLTPGLVSLNPNRLLFVINSAADANGQLIISGDKWDENSNARSTDTEIVEISGVSQDGTSASTQGTPIYNFTDAYLSENSWMGPVTITTSNLELTDVDIYSCGFHQPLHTSLIVPRFHIIDGLPNAIGSGLDSIVYKLRYDRTLKKCELKAISHIEVDDVVQDVIITQSNAALVDQFDLNAVDVAFIQTQLYQKGSTHWDYVNISLYSDWYYSQDPTDE